VEEVLRRWDPIGVEPGVIAPADEYDSYAPHIVSMVDDDCSVATLAAHLEHLTVSVIGARADYDVSFEFAEEIVAALRPGSASMGRVRDINS
jgi:hypothetical protein